jgi:hypothetical protein
MKLIEPQTGVKMQAKIAGKERLARALDSSSSSFSSSSLKTGWSVGVMEN